MEYKKGTTYLLDGKFVVLERRDLRVQHTQIRHPVPVVFSHTHDSNMGICICSFLKTYDIFEKGAEIRCFKRELSPYSPSPERELMLEKKTLPFI